MKIKFTAFCSKQWQNLSDEFIVIKLKDVYKKNWKIFFDKLNKFQVKNDTLRELNCSLEYHYKKRTLDQNSLMWALYSIIAKELNAGMIGNSKLMITKNKLYEDDLKEFAQRTELKVTTEMYNYYKSNYRIEHEQNLPDERIFIRVIESSSHFNTVQMAKWIEMLFMRLADMDIDCSNSSEIYDYWVKWRKYCNDSKISLYGSISTPEAYKKMNHLCESCGKYLNYEDRQLAHIKSRGSGGPDIPDNWLILCSECHIMTQHQSGWKSFVKKYDHLENKIKNMGVI